MSFIVVTRNPHSKRLVIIRAGDDDDDNLPAEYKSHLDAEEMARDQVLCRAWGYEIVEICDI